MRRYEDPVEVRPRDDGSGDLADPVDLRPGSFLWRGRLYVVRAVLGHWRERRAWWNDAAARVLHGETVPAGASGPGGSGGAHAAPSAPVAAEREVWRVEASAGRCAGVGVYDLCRDVGSTWSLVRVAD